MTNQITTLDMGKKFKKTPAGEIPVEWEMLTLGDLAEIRRGASPRPIGDPKFFGEGRGWVRIIDVTRSSKYLRVTEQRLSPLGESNSVQVDPGDVIMSICATIGKPVIVDMKACIHDGFVLFEKLSSQISKDFLFYFLQSKENYLAGKGQPGAQKNLNTSIVAQTEIALPSISEQKKIAEILTAVDKSIEKTRAVIEKTKELKKALMQTLLTRGIGHKKFKKTPVGEIPVEWEARTLGELCLVAPEYGANISAIEFRADCPRYVRITDINEEGILSSADKKSIKPKDAQPYLLGEGDILFARSGATVGKTYLYQKSDGVCAFAGYTIRFKPNPQRLLPEFLSQFTHSQIYYQWVKGMLRAGAQPNINGSEYAGLFLPTPPLYEQKKIAEILTAVDEEIEKEENARKIMEGLKKGLMQALLTGKVRV